MSEGLAGVSDEKTGTNKARRKGATVSRTAVKVENVNCSQCGMRVEADDVFHPGIYCELFALGVQNPALFLQRYRFIPEPAVWGEDAPARQLEAAGVVIA